MIIIIIFYRDIFSTVQWLLGVCVCVCVTKRRRSEMFYDSDIYIYKYLPKCYFSDAGEKNVMADRNQSLRKKKYWIVECCSSVKHVLRKNHGFHFRSLPYNIFDDYTTAKFKLVVPNILWTRLRHLKFDVSVYCYYISCR